MATNQKKPTKDTKPAVKKKVKGVASKKIGTVMAKTFKKVSKSVKKEVKPKLFEERSDIKKLYLYVVIVDLGLEKTIERLLQNLGSSVQFTHLARGTASGDILRVIGATNNQKAYINAIVSEDILSDVQRELAVLFAVTKKNRGIGFAIPFTSIEGVKMYKYLTQTI